MKEFLAKIKANYIKIMHANPLDKDLRDYLALAESKPDDMRLRVRIAECYFRMRKIVETIKTYEEVAQYYLKKNFILKAVNAYKNVLKLDPTLLDYNLKLAELYLKLGMKTEALNEYSIVMQIYLAQRDREDLLDLCKKMIDIEASTPNIRRLAEVYQSLEMTEEAMQTYQKLAKMYLETKDYQSLLRVYELILAHAPENKNMLKDVCVLYLRRKEPDHAIRTMERYKVDQEEAFAELYDKARIMRQMLRNPQGVIPPTARSA